jgi:hypothetical protein
MFHEKHCETKEKTAMAGYPQVEKQYEWSKKGKKYRTKYLDELKNLYGAVKNDTESCEERNPMGVDSTIIKNIGQDR